MSSESVCQAARSWVDVGSFHMRFVVRFMIFTASVRDILDTPSYVEVSYSRLYFSCHSGHTVALATLLAFRSRCIPTINVGNTAT
jgi:hypothetical protein